MSSGGSRVFSSWCQSDWVATAKKGTPTETSDLRQNLKWIIDLSVKGETNNSWEKTCRAQSLVESLRPETEAQPVRISWEIGLNQNEKLMLW